MTDREHARTGLLLTEIILAVLFLAVAAACCLQVFAGAAHLGHKAKQLRMAVNSTENLLQQLKSAEGETEQLQVFYPSAEQVGDGTLYFDEDGHSCLEEERDYSLIFQVEKRRVTADVEVICYDKDGEEIYSLSTVLAVVTEYEGKTPDDN